MKVENGNKVKVEYDGSFDDGEIFDSSSHGDHSHPLEFIAGNGEVIKGFDKAVMGMKEREEKIFIIEPEEAYGNYRKELTRVISRDILPKEKELEVGMSLIIGSPDGRKIPVKITSISEDKVTIDMNHPLAGKRLHFKIKIVEIE